MKIVITSKKFHPDIGGIESMTMMLAEGFSKAGHQVIVVTGSSSPVVDEFPFEVVRNPRAKRLFQLARWCDIYFQNNISLWMLWPLVFVRKPWVVRHATWVSRLDGSLAIQDRIKRFVLRFAYAISNSRAIAQSLTTPSVVIGNPYQDAVFKRLDSISKDRELVFLGRLVSDKGPQLLLEALADLRRSGVIPAATFIGVGPDRDALVLKAKSLGLESQVEFVGAKRGDELVTLLNRHQIMVVPSIWNEPFGIVALEGAACGCVVVGSSGGGLGDAIGPCGETFPNGDLDTLVSILQELLNSPEKLERYRILATAHLDEHRVDAVVARYLSVLDTAYRGEKFSSNLSPEEK